MQSLLIPILLFLSCQSLFAQNWNWAKKFGGIEAESVRALKINTEGAVLLAGSYKDTVAFDAESLQAIEGSDAFLAKLNNAGQVEWALSAGSFNNDTSLDVETDADENIIWLGQYWVEAFFENDTIQAGSNSKAYFLAKYSPDGNLIWVETINGTSTKVVNDLSLDPENNIYLSGYFSDSLLVRDVILTAQAESDAFVVKVSSDGEGLWGERYGTSGTIRPQRIERLSTGELVIAGHLTGTVNFGADQLISVSTDFDVFVAKLNADGTAQWGRIGTGVFDNFLNALVVDESDNIYVSGDFEGVLEIENTTLSTPGFEENLYLIKLAPEGNLLWARGLDDSVFNEASRSFDLAINGSLVLMTGQFLNELIIDELSITGDASFKGFIATFESAQGQVRKLSLLDGTGQTSGTQIAVDNTGQVHIAGVFTEATEFSGIELISAGLTDFFIAQADPVFTGIRDVKYKENSVLLFPNPVDDQLSLEVSEAGDFEISIFDSLGRLLFTFKNQKVINTESLPAGNYFLHYRNAENLELHAFIKI